MNKSWFGGVIAAVIAGGLLVMLFYQAPVRRGRFIPQIAAGDGHTLVLTSWGELYGWGRNEFGQIHVFVAVELRWSSQTNTIYGVQWTPSLDPPQWESLDPVIPGTGRDISIFDSTRIHPAGFYRLQVVR